MIWYISIQNYILDPSRMILRIEQAGRALGRMDGYYFCCWIKANPLGRLQAPPFRFYPLHIALHPIFTWQLMFHFVKSCSRSRCQKGSMPHSALFSWEILTPVEGVTINSKRFLISYNKISGNRQTTNYIGETILTVHLFLDQHNILLSNRVTNLLTKKQLDRDLATFENQF